MIFCDTVHFFSNTQFPFSPNFRFCFSTSEYKVDRQREDVGRQSVGLDSQLEPIERQRIGSVDSERGRRGIALWGEEWTENLQEQSCIAMEVYTYILLPKRDGYLRGAWGCKTWTLQGRCCQVKSAKIGRGQGIWERGGETRGTLVDFEAI